MMEGERGSTWGLVSSALTGGALLGVLFYYFGDDAIEAGMNATYTAVEFLGDNL